MRADLLAGNIFSTLALLAYWLYDIKNVRVHISACGLLFLGLENNRLLLSRTHGTHFMICIVPETHVRKSAFYTDRISNIASERSHYLKTEYITVKTRAYPGGGGTAIYGLYRYVPL